MRILLLTMGARGDVQPFVALGKRLRQAGHDVAVCASSGFAPWIKEHGLGDRRARVVKEFLVILNVA